MVADISIMVVLAVWPLMEFLSGWNMFQWTAVLFLSAVLPGGLSTVEIALLIPAGHIWI
jgi:hypothetical protein